MSMERISCYANVIIQRIFHCDIIRQHILLISNTNVLKELLIWYAANKSIMNTCTIRQIVRKPFIFNKQLNGAEFLNALLNKFANIKQLLEVEFFL